MGSGLFAPLSGGSFHYLGQINFYMRSAIGNECQQIQTINKNYATGQMKFGIGLTNDHLLENTYKILIAVKPYFKIL